MELNIQPKEGELAGCLGITEGRAEELIKQSKEVINSNMVLTKRVEAMIDKPAVFKGMAALSTNLEEYTFCVHGFDSLAEEVIREKRTEAAKSDGIKIQQLPGLTIITLPL